MKVNAKLTGTNKLLSKFDRFGKEGAVEVEEITKLTSHGIEANAKIKAPVDLGKLRQGIKSDKLKKLTYVVLASEAYSAFVEFGTGGLVDIPKGWEKMAEQFRGKGKRKVNLSPQPFLYPAFKKGSRIYKQDLKRALAKLTNKYNKK